jgi:hypothetical protein
MSSSRNRQVQPRKATITKRRREDEANPQEEESDRQDRQEGDPERGAAAAAAATAPTKRWAHTAAKYDFDLQQLLNEVKKNPGAQSNDKGKKPKALGGKLSATGTFVKESAAGKLSANQGDIQNDLTRLKLGKAVGANIPEEFVTKVTQRARLTLDLAEISYNRARGHSDFALKEFGLAKCRADNCKEAFKSAVELEQRAAAALDKARDLYKESLQRDGCRHGTEELQHSAEAVTVRDHGFEDTRNLYTVFRKCYNCLEVQPASETETNDYLNRNYLI